MSEIRTSPVPRWVTAPLLGSLLLLGTSAAPLDTVKHSEMLRVGARDIRFDFTDYPVRAQRSLDLIFGPDTGEVGALRGRLRLLQPDGKVSDEKAYIPRFPRDRRFWGLDSYAMNTPGQWTVELTIGSDTARLPIMVGPPPAGPPANLISALALLPIAALLVLITRAWRRVRPLRQSDARVW